MTDFENLGMLRAAHIDLMRQATQASGLDPDYASTASPAIQQPDTQTIRSFVQNAVATGRHIQGPSDRRAAQRIVNYWATELSGRSDIAGEDLKFARLAPPGNGPTPAGSDSGVLELSSTDLGTNPVAETLAYPGLAPAEAMIAPKSTEDPTTGALTPDDHAERLRIRVAALARQWRSTGFTGYLLSGQALAEARSLPMDKDIQDFVAASNQAEADKAAAETARLRTVGRIKNTVIAGFVLLSCLLVFAVIQAWRNVAEIKQLNADLNGQMEKTIAAANTAQIATQEAQNALAILTQAQVDALSKVADLNRQTTSQQDAQNRLDAAVALIAHAVQLGQIDPADIDPKLYEMVLVHVAQAVQSKTLQAIYLRPEIRAGVNKLIGGTDATSYDKLAGYDAGFLGNHIALPKLSSSPAALALLAYENYTLMMNSNQRMAYFTAANLDRSQRQVLQSPASGLQPDPRLDDNQQPDPNWYNFRADDVGQWVDAGDIAWGAAVAGDPGKAALRLGASTNVLTNSVPQPTGMPTGAWGGLADWMRTQHNPLANKVTIFAGPVFGPPAAEGQSPQPVAYWKVAISAVPEAGKSAAASNSLADPLYVIDAFLIPRDAGNQPFDPDIFRITIEDLETQTGLTFDTLVEWTDAAKNAGLQGLTLGDGLAARVFSLTSAEDRESRAIAAELATILGRTDLPVPEVAKVITSLVNMAGADRFLPLSAQAKSTVMQGLAAVPPAFWTRPEHMATRARARIATTDPILATQPATLPPDVAARLLTNLAVQTETQTVYLQFAGMKLEDAQAFSARLKALGWAVAGEERTGDAAKLNEIRYNPTDGTDMDAAVKLAADLTAAGQPVTARPVAIIVPGILEIWISI